MSSFFDKVKQGVNETGKQAKIAVETTRLKGQIGAKQKDINSRYLEIGRNFFQAFQSNDFDSVQATLESLCHEIIGLEKEIEDIQIKIEELKEPDAEESAPAAGSRVCECGTEVAMEAKFCPACGHKF